jgi:hypothetical protein
MECGANVFVFPSKAFAPATACNKVAKHPKSKSFANASCAGSPTSCWINLLAVWPFTAGRQKSFDKCAHAGTRHNFGRILLVVVCGAAALL